LQHNIVDEAEKSTVQKKPARKIVVYAAGGILILFVVYLLFKNLSFQNIQFTSRKPVNK
jgi:hypothetical protein